MRKLPLIALLLLGSPAWAAEWTESVSFLVKTDGSPSGTAHVYDSEDFQRMLILFEDREQAAVLDLATVSVSAIPADSIRSSETDGALHSPEGIGSYLAPLEQEEGTLSFLWNETPVTIEPVPPLIGPVDRERVFAVKPTYETAAKEYEPAEEAAAALRAVDAPTEIHVFFGTWCHACKKSVPPLIGTIDRVGNDRFTMRFIGVDEDLTEPAEEIDRYYVSTTPTIVVLQNGGEIGRIEDEPVVSVEADLVAILKSKR
ncbi:MAG: hypothetical protein GF346_03765 [Candidatus Eisenbacteria bacterium]|nr:hypothetical protein [Candidatus Latescibacterota bacterium]MBD3301541.1 hypothetical protein [Candidatus Eisenbacteria bacterium]